MAVYMSPDDKPKESILERFAIAEDSHPTVTELHVHRDLLTRVLDAAEYLNSSVEDGREKSLALTHLEEALLWAGKAIFK